MCLWFPLYKPGNILYEVGSILNRSLIRASNIKGNYSCDGLYICNIYIKRLSRDIVALSTYNIPLMFDVFTANG